MKLKKELYRDSPEGRVNFTSSKYLSRVKIFLILFVALIITAIAFSIQLKGVTYTTLIISGVSAIVSYLFVSFICTHSKTAALKGDTLIMNSMSQKSSVMSVGSVRKVKSKSILGLCWTSIRYKIDGRANWIFIVTQKLKNSPEEIINNALEIKRENKKANHKPGSVITKQA